MKKPAILFILMMPFWLCAQNNGNNKEEGLRQVVYNWLDQLGEKGLELRDDSLIIGKEVQMLMEDESYRRLLYPEKYSWDQVTHFIRLQDLKKAFWYMINLYPDNDINKEIVLKSVLAYDQLFKMDEILINTFYSYCFTDPEVSVFNGGKPEIVRPDLLEAKLSNVREMVSYIHYYRQTQQETKSEP